MRLLEAILTDRAFNKPVPLAILKALTLPIANHSAAVTLGLAERVLFPADIARLSWELYSMERKLSNIMRFVDTFDELTDVAHLWFPVPYRTCWMEFEGEAGSVFGLFLDTELRTADLFSGCNHEADGFIVGHVGQFSLALDNGFARFDRIVWKDPGDMSVMANMMLGMAVLSMQFTASQSLVTLKRVGGDRRRGASRLVKSRFSAPVFSHNRVELVLPRQVEIIEGKAVLTERATGTRKHEVGAYFARRGEKKVWTLIPAHSRGNEALGIVVKTKAIRFAA